MAFSALIYKNWLLIRRAQCSFICLLLLAINIVRGDESLPLTAYGNKYILTLNGCFTCFAIAVLIFDQSAEAVVNAVIRNYNSVYGTHREIHTDQIDCFESALFQSFCNLFRICKIRTSGDRPQSNGICVSA